MKRFMTPIAALAALSQLVPATASAQEAGGDREQVEEIVVTGRRSGVPIWRVTGPGTTLFLVGAINGVSKTTHWDPEALADTLRKADRVMFPQSHALTVGNPFRLIGWLAKWKAMASLPKEQSLGQFVGPDEIRRLDALAARGMAPAKFDRRHPLHLAGDLREKAAGKIEYGRNALEYVERTVKKEKLKLTVDPVAKSKAKPVVKDLFASQPQEHVACLVDSIAAAEEGPEAIQARSDAWAAKRVPQVLSYAIDRTHSSCWPAGEEFLASSEELVEEMRAILSGSEVTVAVLRLRSLAEKGGVLDRLEAAGFEVDGPAWK
jgi:uncharacterized protein YbaP (TraB family)